MGVGKNYKRSLNKWVVKMQTRGLQVQKYGNTWVLVLDKPTRKFLEITEVGQKLIVGNPAIDAQADMQNLPDGQTSLPLPATPAINTASNEITIVEQVRLPSGGILVKLSNGKSFKSNLRVSDKQWAEMQGKEYDENSAIRLSKSPETNSSTAQLPVGVTMSASGIVDLSKIKPEETKKEDKEEEIEEIFAETEPDNTDDNF
jgi:hypothetical protein